LEELQLPGPGLGAKTGPVIESEFPQSRRAACARVKLSDEFCQSRFAGFLRVFSDPHGVKSESSEDLPRRAGCDQRLLSIPVGWIDPALNETVDSCPVCPFEDFGKIRFQAGVG
jgi:hypothetical protein